MSTSSFLVIALVETVIVGSMFLLYPRFARRGLLFGVYVGEQAWDGDEARAITRAWDRAMVAWLLVSLVMAVALAGVVPTTPLMAVYPLALVAGFLVLYLRAYYRARRLAMNTPLPGVALLQPVPEASLTLPLAALAGGVLAGIVSIAHAAAWYPSLPGQVPTHFGISGAPDAWRTRSLATVMLGPVLTLVLGIALGGISIFTARAKRAVRFPDTEISLAAQLRFRNAVTRLISTITLMMAAALTLINIATIRTAAGLAAGLPRAAMALMLTMVAVALIGVLYIGLRYGQGGARLERQARSPLTDGLADNRRWFLGMFYVNRDDPSLLVEDRFGLGYTLNLGNWKAVAMFGGFLAVVLGILVAVRLLK